ncbi:undecaprenyl/decaprenyl-phosphate alpha-N-acetylglucosaminyl 1-phosphate transferase [candidate division KSB1 bacterium]|nr:undecaprenyl/decaprenyl-phosphate alpha-N-acetylglucosaminyl 1-phosphate transferase [candidate division KSB1 bacterium]
MILLLCTISLTFIITIILTPIIRSAAKKIQIWAKHNNRTIHNGHVPLLGGVPIVVAFLCGVIFIYLFSGAQFDYLKRELIVFLLGGIIVHFTGIIDDIKGISCYQKLTGQFIAATIVILFGYNINQVISPFGNIISLGYFNIPFTLFWIVFLTNALNLIDGLDGLAAGITLGALFIMIAISLWFNNLASAIPSAILAGTLAGFLIFNFNPAKIFLGDSGSLFLGFMLACFSINGTFRENAALSMTIPIVVLGVPILDTTVAFVRRIKNGIHPFKADKYHIHHRVLNLGYSHRTTVLLLYGVSLFWGVIGLCMSIVYYPYHYFLLLLFFTSILWGLKRIKMIRLF